MKKTYIIPQTTFEVLEPETMLSASRFDSTSNTQNIIPTEEEYSDEFCTKGFGESIFDD